MPYQLSDSLSIRARNLAFYELVAEKLKEQRICSLPPFNQTFFSSYIPSFFFYCRHPLF